MPFRVFDYFFIVGAEKAGTTSLHKYLVQHPDITSADYKELQYFNREKSYSKGGGHFRSFFPVFSKAKFAVDATPAYMINNLVAQRIFDSHPGSKIIIVLREPSSRALSAFNMYQQAINEPSFTKYLVDADPCFIKFYKPLIEGKVKAELKYFLDYEIELIKQKENGDPVLIRCGIYGPQIERYIKLFGEKNVLILFSDDLRDQPASTTNLVCDFLGLEPLVSAKFPLQHVREYVVGKSDKKMIRQYAGYLFDQDKRVLIERYGLKVPW